MGAPGVDLYWLLEKLEKEQYELTDPKHTVTDLAERRGWNRRAASLIAELREDDGTAVQAEAVDLRLKHALTGEGG